MAQKQVFTTVAVGVPGAKASLNPFVYHPNTLRAEGEVTVGNFVWPGPDTEIEAATTGAGAPIGLVERNIVYPNYDILDDGTLVVPDGSTLTIGIRGDYWVVTSTAATGGQKVYANTADGSIAADNAGATVAGHVETAWSVETAGAAGELIMISRH